MEMSNLCSDLLPQTVRGVREAVERRLTQLERPANKLLRMKLMAPCLVR